MTLPFICCRALLSAVLCLATTPLLRAQEATQREKDDATMRQAALIFEGTLVRTVHYVNADSNRLFRSSEVRLTKTLRGRLAPGTVQVAYKGFRFSHKQWDEDRGEMVYRLLPNTGHVRGDGFGPTLPPATTILFFCRPLPATYEAPPPVMATNNAGVWEIVGLAYYLYGANGPIQSDVGGEFPNQQALYRYLADTYHLPNRAETLNTH
ncbi:hypothetical protein Q5H92_10620 [Hymenobacter sp. M29]|uniref:Uncharacterized protein n=1 Tax=Hymenobacter mellowenesis TaxID=3063995 RepID=A0ABT9AAE6_9BACT|nr:hypothetical protein [Hymenobacter sp. M29]MDO7846811.1 hypothetical protein [Hymenobacter sp. M29]